MAKKRIVTIDGMLGGMRSTQYFGVEGQQTYLDGVGVDPDLPVSDAVGDRLTAAVIRPSGYASFDGAEVNSNVNWLDANPKAALLYAYLANGKLITYSTSLASETLAGTASSSSGNGMAYYNNYLYLATNTNISRYGPLNGSPSLTDSVWTGSTLGTQTALVNTTYPSLRGSGTYPNHPMHVHSDGKLYLGDFDSTSSTASTRGKGLIHYIRTTYGSAEGDTNDASTYKALDLPFGMMPMDIESYGTDLAIVATQTTNTTFKQGPAYLYLWNTTAKSFHTAIPLPDPLVTAMKNINGLLYIWSGPISNGADSSNGYRVSVYAGGQSVKTIEYSNVGAPPTAGAVDAIGDRPCWGTFHQIPTTTGASPEYFAVVMAKGSKDPEIPSGLHGIINSKATCTAGDGLVTAIKNVQHSSFSYPKLVVGWRDSTSYGIDAQSTTYGTSVWRSGLYSTSERATVTKITLKLGTALASNMTITPKVFSDDFSASKTCTVVNSTNFSGRRVVLYPAAPIKNNFCLELRFTGTALCPVLFPITIEVDETGD